MNQFTRWILFFLFFLSGFCSLLYQVVWTRLAFAAFGIITPVLSVVLSVFMLGLAVGSWVGGRWILSFVQKTGWSAIFFYAGAEFLIGIGAFVVPKSFIIGEHILLVGGETNSTGYLLWSALVLAASLLPWCLCMGATFPFMMAYIRELGSGNTESFSFLYLANVLGAMGGVLSTAVVLIEVLGFHHTLWVAAVGNFTIATICAFLGWRQRPPIISSAEPVISRTSALPDARLIKGILFSTGFIAMAMEVVWTRAFTPVLKTQVYSFAMIVFTYLGATFLGSWIYRRDLRRNRVSPVEKMTAALAMTALLPVLINNPRFIAVNYWELSINFLSAFILLAGICPFCALLGYLTPNLIDRFAGGHPTSAGQAYALNVLGCIMGPLFACYLLLPYLSERYALILLSVPFLVFYIFLGKFGFLWKRWCLFLIMLVGLAWASLCSEDYENMLYKTTANTTVRRDYTASVISFGNGLNKWLLVNGIGMTTLTPITKFAAHLPLAYHKGKPESALVICFGMGTTYRSALSWNIDTTVVELVPSVTKAFGFYHADAARCLNDPNGHIVTDDGRRYLMRSSRKFDVIIVDPPPPIEAAGSSLLFSKEFYALAKQHLNPGGVVQMWYPGGHDISTAQAVLRSAHDSFPYIRCFPSIEGWGLHILASMQPIDQLSPQQIASQIPENARNDLLEWANSTNVLEYVGKVILHEIPAQKVSQFIGSNSAIQIIDDHPYNEYFLLRQMKR